MNIGVDETFWVILIIPGGERHGYPVMLPTNYIQMKDHDWYVGEMTKDKAEQVLSSQPDGAFLIRNSDTSPGDFELAVVHEGVR